MSLPTPPAAPSVAMPDNLRDQFAQLNSSQMDQALRLMDFIIQRLEQRNPAPVTAEELRLVAAGVAPKNSP